MEGAGRIVTVLACSAIAMALLCIVTPLAVALEGLDGLGDIGGGDAGFDPHGQVGAKRREARYG